LLQSKRRSPPHSILPLILRSIPALNPALNTAFNPCGTGPAPLPTLGCVASRTEPCISAAMSTSGAVYAVVPAAWLWGSGTSSAARLAKLPLRPPPPLSLCPRSRRRAQLAL
jgi:hypothetical protein